MRMTRAAASDLVSVAVRGAEALYCIALSSLVAITSVSFQILFFY